MVELTVHVRKEVLKRATSALRREAKVPAVLYGRGRDPMHLYVDQKEFVKMVRAHHETGLVNLTIMDGDQKTEQQALYKEVSVSTLKRRVNHIDFQAIRAGEKINMKVVIVTKGTPVGVTDEGGVLVHTLSEVEIRVLPDKIPDQIEIEVGQLKLGDAVHLRDLKLEGVEILHDLDAIVASVTHVREEKPMAAAAAEGEAAAATADGAAAQPAEGAAPAAGKKEAKDKK